MAAAKAQSQARSATAFADWKRSQGMDAKPFDPGLRENRQEREKRVYQTRTYNSYYRAPSTVVIYHDNYDNAFLQYASVAFFYNHWDSIDRSRFDEQRLRDLEREMAVMQAKGIRRDPNYTDPGVDPDLAYSRDVAYQTPAQVPVATSVQTSQGSGGPSAATIFGVIIVLGAAIVIVWFVFFRRGTV